MSANEEIGARVASALGAGRTQAWLAASVGMTRDAMSRAVNGSRGFSSVEIAKIAEVLDADVHHLITGWSDPNRLVVAARHDFDPVSGARSVPHREADDEVLRSVALAYRQAYPTGPAEPLPKLPDTPGAVRNALGEGFVRDFAERLEERLGVDVVRIQALSTAYSFTQNGYRVILLPAHGNWWRSNFSLAHEVAHLALGHHDVEDDGGDAREVAANRFAAELLLPLDLMRSVNWENAEPVEYAQFLWDHGVGTTALANRLDSLGIASPATVDALRGQRLPGAMRKHQSQMDLPGPPADMHPFARALYDPFDSRIRQAAMRRFPLTLITAHRKRIEEEGLNPGTLAWMLESEVEDLIDAPTEAPSVSLDDVFA